MDAAQGVEAQTVSNTYLAIENDLNIIPIINKVDLKSAMVEDVKIQIMELIGCDENDIIEASAKSGFGLENVFSAIIENINAPENNDGLPPRALIFDSVYDNYRGSIAYIRIYDGVLKAGMVAKFFSHDRQYEITEVGHFILDKIKTQELRSGDVGYLVGSIRDVSDIEPGDTITTKDHMAKEPCDFQY